MHHRSNFFSSLSRLEKRLKLETQSPQQPQEEEEEEERTTAKPANQQNNAETTQTESLGTPMYLYQSHPTSTCNDPASNLQESEPPPAFFSNSIPVSPIQQIPDTQNPEKVDEIEMLLQLLGFDDEDQKDVGFGVGDVEDEVFYGKIVGVKGPKSKKELERLNGWIKYLLNKDGDGGIKQPLRLAHLLLAKFSFVHMDDDDFEGPRFPPTVEDFLQYDPPVN